MADETAEKRKNHQNSERCALPLKTAYFEKHVLIDSVKLMCPH